MSVNLEIFYAYNNGLITGDFPAVFETRADDVIWHQPGQNSTSGTVVGKEALGVHLSQFSAEVPTVIFALYTFRVSGIYCAGV